MHYQSTWTGYKSLIDDPRFFLAKDGKYNPRSELVATINYFFSDPDHLTGEKVCRFIARYIWLIEQLGIDPKTLPVTSCPELAHVIPKSATMVFPTYHPNSPASMFGHTLITIETEYPNQLLTRSVSYAANATDTNGILFAFKGLFGFYQGLYTVLPYYKKIQQYNDIKQRDVWEYKLNLTPAELNRMVLHIRELEHIYADYFFFDENCSYNLLFLLEAARPSAHLVDQFSMYVLPIDTVKVVKDANMIEQVSYRPSKTTKLKYKFSLLDDNRQNQVLKILHGKADVESILTSESSQTDKIIMLDTVIEALQYSYIKKKMNKTEYKKAFLTALKTRSKLKTPKPIYDIKVPHHPDEVHDSARLRTGLGIENAHMFQEIGWRPAFTDLIDPDYGYKEGMQIQFMDTNFRYDDKTGRLKLQRLNAIDIISLSPRDNFFNPVSWKVATGFYQERTSDIKNDIDLIYALNTGGGFTYSSDIIDLYYLMFETEIDLGGGFEQNYALGAGASCGIIQHFSSFWKCHLFSRAIFYKLGDEHDLYEACLQQSLKLKKNIYLELDGSWKDRFYEHYFTGMISCHFYF